MDNLFVGGNFVLNSGQRSDFKIECDALTEKDWRTIAYVISKKYDFKFVRGVPTGGIELQNRLLTYRNPESNTFLIVDDVLTTGGSMERFKQVLEGTYPPYDYKGVVLFAREKCPDWIEPVFQMWEM